MSTCDVLGVQVLNADFLDIRNDDEQQEIWGHLKTNQSTPSMINKQKQHKLPVHFHGLYNAIYIHKNHTH